MAFRKTFKINMLLFKIVFFCLFIFSLLMGIFLTNIVKNHSKDENVKIDYIESWTVIDEEGHTRIFVENDMSVAAILNNLRARKRK